MLVLSRDKGLILYVSGEEWKYIPLSNGTFDKVKIPMKKIEFSPLHSPIKCNLPKIGPVDGARGFWDSSVPHTRENLSEQEAIDAILSHKSYGRDFIAVDGGEEVDPNNVLVPRGDGVYCKVCDKLLDKRGSHMHLDSKTHQRNLEKEGDSLSSQLRKEGGA